MSRFAIVIAAFATMASCDVNKYCLNCEVGDGGETDGADGMTDGNGDGSQGDGGPCVPTGIEVCDNKDNDCDGTIDQGSIAGLGVACDNQTGECAGGVTECLAGAVTCTKNPSPEQCDFKDNDCNGQTDEGDPGGGARCGTDAGECVSGIFHCNKAIGAVQCGLACGTGNAIDCPIGGPVPPFGVAETCNGKDDDCDTDFDEDVPALGSCGGGPGANPNEGLCQTGIAICDGAGGTICTGNPVGPDFEKCDGEDNDCDGAADEDFNTDTDPLNCGSCGNVCVFPNSFEGCAGGNCTIVACADGFHNNNSPGVADADGCEFGPCTIQSSVEVCNGIDDDCNPATTEAALPPPNNFCLTAGQCAGAAASCQGTLGFRCNYNSDVTQDANGNVLQETLCDGLDNDCDGLVDEGQPNLGDACGDNAVGKCRGTGSFQCDAANLNGPAKCVITSPGVTPTAGAEMNHWRPIIGGPNGLDSNPGFVASPPSPDASKMVSASMG